VELNALMEFDHVIQVHADGTITEPKDVWAPEVYVDTDGDGQILAEHDREMLAGLREHGWDLMNGYSSQSGYSGPIMHPSESIGGRMEQDIRATPGYYVAVTVEVISDSEEEPAGWAVARGDVVHIVSATAVHPDGDRSRTHHLAMCGADLGTYEDASRVHPVGNYLSATSPALAKVSCPACRARRANR
jgi:hypothetical protein